MSLPFSRLLIRSAALALLALSGCSSILPARAPAPDVYRLSEVSLPPRTERPIAAQLVIDVPLADGGLNTDRIAVHDDPYELTYLAGARWTDPAPKLVQSALVQALESLNAFTGVGRPEDGLKRNFELVSDLRAFDIVTQGVSHPNISVAIAVKLLRAPGGEVISSRLFTAKAEAKGRADEEVVAAYNQAMTQVASDIAGWVLDAASQRRPQTALTEPGVPSAPTPLATAPAAPSP